jgi:hypothetical protein
MIVKAIGSGLTNKDAALVAGIDRGTIDDWCEKYPAFSSRLAQAHADRAAAWLEGIAAAAPKDWRAYEALLDRCAPEYRKTTTVDIGNKDGEPFVMELKVIAK